MALALACTGVLPKAQAVIPAPDGGYPGGNTAEGQNALLSLTSGQFNTAIGYLSLLSDTTSSFNTAIGAGTLLASTGDENTATGAGALLSNTSGPANSANGAFALFNNTIGDNNTAIGDRALFHNTTGNGNTANGSHALVSNTTGFSNTADGDGALQSSTTAGDNTGVGRSALANNTGSSNTALGFLAGLALTTGDNNIDIGNQGFASESATIRIGASGNQTKTFIAGIRGVTTVNAAIPVVIDTVGQLGTMSSSRRFKKEIKPMDQASGAILGLKPVTFHYKSDTGSTPQFGLIAEEVAAVNPDLVVRDENGEIYTVRYDAVNAMLLNEFLKEHREVEEQKATITQLKSGLEALTATVKQQASQIQKVNAKIENSKPAAQTVFNDR